MSFFFIVIGRREFEPNYCDDQVFHDISKRSARDQAVGKPSTLIALTLESCTKDWGRFQPYGTSFRLYMSWNYIYSRLHCRSLDTIHQALISYLSELQTPVPTFEKVLMAIL